MSSPHINAEKGDFAKVVLMPGDPTRAKWMADTFLHDVTLVSSVRGILAFTGLTANNKRISIMASGMGIPSIGIYSYELYTQFDVETIIRVGTCGAYQENINLFDVIVASGASSDSNYAAQFHLDGHYSAIADFEVTKLAYDKLHARKMPFQIGNVLSADVFYDFDKNVADLWTRLNVLAVEMESYGLYINASLLRKKALCLLTVTDHFRKPEKASILQRQTGLKNMIQIAIDVAEELV